MTADIRATYRPMIAQLACTSSTQLPFMSNWTAGIKQDTPGSRNEHGKALCYVTLYISLMYK